MKILHNIRAKLIIGISLALTLLFLISSLAFADNIINDVVIGENDTIYIIESTSIDFWIVDTNGDGQKGCNASDGTPATVTIITPEEVAATPTVLEFAECKVKQSVVFTASKVGTYPITVEVEDSGEGSYHTTPASFDLIVLPLPYDLYLPIVFR